MANVRISDLPSGTVASTDAFAVVKAGVTTQVVLSTVLSDISGKAATVHTHAQADVTSLVTDLAGKAALNHTHAGLDTLTPLDQSAWTWVNQGTASVVQASSLVRLTLPNDGSEEMRGRETTSPATPYTITILIYPGPLFATAARSGGGLFFRESATSKIIMFSWIASTPLNGPRFEVRRNSDPVTNVNSVVTSDMEGVGSNVWLRIADDGTNTIYSFSFDGVNYDTFLSEARGAHFTVAPNRYGIGMMNFGGGGTASITYPSLAVT